MNNDQYVEPTFSPNEKLSPKEAVHWYSTTGGKVFIVISTIVISLLLLFGSLVGYYLVQLESGNEESIIKELRKSQEKFSTLTAKKSPSNELSVSDILGSIDGMTPSYGNIGAKYTVVMFIDFECPFCQESYGTFREVTKNRANDVRVIFKHFPISSIHPNAGFAANAGECAREQGTFWEFYDQVFLHKDLSETALKSYGERVGVDMTKFTVCMENFTYLDRIQKDLADGINLGVRGTPTFIINTKRYEGVFTKTDWKKLLQ